MHLDTALAASVTDSDSTDFNGGNLTVSITANKVAGEDVLGVDTSGTVTLSSGLTAGSTVSVSGTTIGTIAASGDGAGGHDLVIDFNANATPGLVTSLVDALTYSDSNSSSPSTAARTVNVSLNDGGRGTCRSWKRHR